ncbi:GerAB/ArcD/ProY family transporter [Neobacillus sp. PS3-34]|uniref:GerAB/ArcD/ProY family transporter n=1 Tax=Neobacillus sp. PS3-34 TaxID=3070678 RepID=UPI0027E14936|nr:GerAB/ArcD/ProY family transporter [Neobacillus sp. PS3-34]WML47834.1 GerAB/ArcD/ProY family transporter [Neobacillus sp. PS3-34]
MKVDLHPKEGLLFNAFLVMFVIHVTQTGVGIVGLPRVVFLKSGHDGWISVLLAGIATGIVLWLMILMLRQYKNADLYGIQVDVFGNFIGKALGVLYMLYLTSTFFVIVMNYIEIVQAWVFPDMPTWMLSASLIFLTVYAVLGGIRVVVGISFLSFLATIWLIFILAVPLKYSDPTHIFPIWNTSYKNILMGIYKTSFSIIGFEMILFIYPYIKEKKKALLYSEIGNLYTTILFTIITFVAMIFFSEESLKRTIWPVLSMFKIVRLPNLERFEFIAVSFWMLIILPNLCAYLWAASKGFSRLFNIKQKKGIYILAFLSWGGTFFIKARYQMNLTTDYVGIIGFYAAFCYPILLSVIVLIKKWWGRRKHANAQNG